MLSDPAGEETTRDGSRIDGSLMNTEGEGSSLGAMVSCDHRHGGGEVDGFSQTFQSAEDQKRTEAAAEGRCGADDAPGMEAEEDGAPPLHPVHENSGDRSAERIGPGKTGSKQAELQIVEGKIPCEEGKDRKDGLAIGVVEETDRPQHGNDGPAMLWQPGRGFKLLGDVAILLHGWSPVSHCRWIQQE